MKILMTIFKNIEKFICHKPFLFLFLILSQVICTVVIFLICGFVDNANRSSEVIQEAQKEFSVNLVTDDYDLMNSLYTDGEGNYFDQDGNPISEEELKNFYNQKYPDGYYSDKNYVKNIKYKIKDLVDFLGEDYGSVSILGRVDDTYGAYYFSSGYPISDRDVSKELSEFYNSSENIIRLDPNVYTNEAGEPLKIGDKINLGGVDYTVKVLQDDVANMDIPYKALQDNFYVTTVWVWLKDIPSQERCDEISEKIKSMFETDDYSSPKPRVLEELQNIQLAYGISAAAIIMILLNISRVYSYALTYRKKSFAVMNICGASKSKVFLMYLLELMLTLLATFGIGLIIFHTLVLQPVAAIYPNFLISMTPQTYLIIFGIYFVVSILVMSLTISRFISRSAVEMERSAD